VNFEKGSPGAVAPSPAQRAELLAALHGIEAWGRERRWTGPDPYDALNARRLGRLKKTALGRRLLTQLVKRSPIDVRPILRIPPGRSAAAFAQVAAAYARAGPLGEDVAGAHLREAVNALDSLRCEGFDEPCWGYHFDVQTRVFFYPKDSPNTIASAFAGEAMLDAYETLAEPWLLERAIGTGEFFLRHVPQTEDGDGAFFGYLVGDRTPIHNASMLVAALLARLGRIADRADMRTASEAAVRWTVSRQRPDGWWPYGERPQLAWIDNFHTGYVLQALLTCAAAGLDVDGGAALDRGLAYYRRALFLDDGTPKYMADAVYPIDAQCVAQAIQTMALAGRRDARYAEFAWTVFDFARRRMGRADGSYLFQRRRYWSNPVPHIRWMAAPMFAALACLQTLTPAAT